MPARPRLREIIFNLSNLIAFAIAAAVLLWLSPGTEFLREVGLKGDLIRLTLLGVAVIPGLVGGAFIRMIVAGPDQVSKDPSEA